MSEHPAVVPALAWDDARREILLLDQRLLPGRVHVLRIDGVDALVTAMRGLAVRGAPLLAIAAAYGVALAAARAETNPAHAVERAIAALLAARPTAVNTRHALERLRARAARCGERDLAAALLAEARELHAEDAAACEAMSRHGAELLPAGGTILTHCNTGRLATGGIGTALGCILTACASGKRLHVFVDETRPLLQGARLTMFELAEARIPATLVPDAAAAALIARGEVAVVVVGADRIARNGDFANKVGTLPLALAARRFDVPFYVVAPTSSLDGEIPDGTRIQIEERSEDEVLGPLRPDRVPAGARARNPAFDVTPGDLVNALVTERGVARPPLLAAIKAWLPNGR